MFGRHGHDRPAPGDPIGGWCPSCGSAFGVGARHCPDCGGEVTSLVTAPVDTVDWDGEPVGGWCPSCGGEFRLGIVTCPECGVELSHEPPPPPEAEAAQRHDVLEYDLADWDAARRVELNRHLDAFRITHEWDGDGRLHAPGSHEAQVDEMIDAIDGLDEDSPASEYELPDWTMEQCDELVRRLQEADLSFEWDGCVLAVDPWLEARVDGIVRSIDPSFPTQVTDG